MGACLGAEELGEHPWRREGPRPLESGADLSWEPRAGPGDPSRCCHAHDCCYGRLQKRGCEPKLERYLFSASKSNILCCE